MIEVSAILGPADEATKEMVRKDLGENPDKLERQIELFMEWLRCEPHLPSDIDGRFIRNFVRFCKCDLEKAKRKMENFLSVRIKLKSYYSNNELTESYFDEIMLHRIFQIIPTITPEGYRIAYACLPKDVNQFDFEKIFRYGLMLADLVLFEEQAASIIAIWDMENLSARHLGKVNVKILIEAVNMLYNVLPLRYKAMHYVNVPHVPEPLIAMLKKMVPQKVIDRAHVHKNLESLRKCIPTSHLPKKYGGDWNLEDLSNNQKSYFVHNEEWKAKTSKLRLAGPVSRHKTELYSFEEFGMGGSFRQLSID